MCKDPLQHYNLLNFNFALTRHVLHDFEALVVMMNDGHVINAITNMNYYGIVKLC